MDIYLYHKLHRKKGQQAKSSLFVRRIIEHVLNSMCVPIHQKMSVRVQQMIIIVAIEKPINEV